MCGEGCLTVAKTGLLCFILEGTADPTVGSPGSVGSITVTHCANHMHGTGTGHLCKLSYPSSECDLLQGVRLKPPFPLSPPFTLSTNPHLTGSLFRHTGRNSTNPLSSLPCEKLSSETVLLLAFSLCVCVPVCVSVCLSVSVSP